MSRPFPPPGPSGPGAPPPPNVDSSGGNNPAAGGPSSVPSQAIASPVQVMLAQLFQVLRRLSMENPILSPGLEKASQGIQEAQTALLTSGPTPGPTENPPY